MSLQISVAIPLLNEEESLPELTQWIDKVMKANNFSYEIIFVDDGSTDGSWNLIQELSKNVDSSNVFEFMRLAANDSSNKETQHEAYWIVVYIFLNRTCGMDISPSFSSVNIKKMLKSINLLEFSFEEDCLVYK